MVFEDYGFKTGRIVFPGLDLVVRLNEDRYFRNDGIVADMNQHTDEVLGEFGASNHDYQRRVPAYGRHIPFNSNSDKASLIFIRDWNPETNRFSYGHESTHAIIYLGLENYFMDMLKNKGFTLDPFKRYDDEESIAHVGGLVSIYQTNQSNEFVNHPELTPIFEELMNSKI